MSPLNIFILTIAILHLLVILFFITGLFRRSRSDKNREKPFVSVLISARNEAENIEECLLSILGQSYPHDLFEILVVNDRSSDNTGELARKMDSNGKRIIVIDVESVPTGIHPKKNAISLGVAAAKGEIIIETDADVLVERNWIELTVERFLPDIGMVVGSSTIRAKKKTLLENLQAVDFLLLVASAQGALGHGIPMGATGQNLAYRKKVFEEVGGLEIHTRRYVSNDMLFLTKVSQTDWKIVGNMSKETIVSTLAVEGWKGFFSQRTRWASNAYWKDINFLLLLMLSVNYFINLFVAASIFIMIANPTFSFPIFGLIAYKVTIEALFLYVASKQLNRKDLFAKFLPWFLAVTPYVIIVGILGGIGIFSWKGYKVRSV